MRWLLIDFLAAVRDYAPTNPDQYVVEQAKEVATRNRMDKRPPHRSDSEQKSSFAGETPAYIRIVPGIFFVFCRSDPRGTAVAVFAVCLVPRAWRFRIDAMRRRRQQDGERSR